MDGGKSNKIQLNMAPPILQDKFILIRNLAIICMIGNLLYFLFPFPAIVWRLSFVLLSLYCVYEDYIRYGFSGIEKAILIFTGLNLIYFFVSYLWSNPSTTTLGNTLYALLAFVMFAFLGKEGILTQKFILVSAILLTVAAIPSFYNAQKLALAKLASGGDEATVNASTIFLMLLPLLFCLRNRVVSLVLFCVCLFFLISGAKRGNILAAVIPAVLYAWMLYKENKRNVFKISVLIIAIAAIALWIKDLVLSDEYLLRRLEQTLEGNTSGRDVIYSTMWDMWYGVGSIVNLLFGYGYNGTFLYSPMHKFAHNDWLEILVDFGLLGALFYAAIFISFARLYFRLDRGYPRLVCIAIVSIWFMKTLYSMGFTDEMLALMSIPFGCLFSEYFTDNRITE